MILAIYSDKQHPTHVCETYTFDFAYSTDDFNPKVSLTLSEGTKVLLIKGRKSLQQVVRRTIFITQNLDPLPEQCWLTVKLLYYDDRTPSTYSPAGFRDARHDEHFYFAGGDDEMVSLEIKYAHVSRSQWKPVVFLLRRMCMILGGRLM
jgi:hypothetical protein